MYRPSLLDHMPKTKRGHGTTHPKVCPCVEVTCANNLPAIRKTGKRQGDPHEDQLSNANDWKEEHGFNTHTPFEECFGAR